MSTNRFIEARRTAVKKVKFIGQELVIVKLSVGQVLEVQSLAKAVEAEKDAGAKHIDLLFMIVRMGAPELKDLSDEEMNELPMEELSELSSGIMSYSGLGNKSK